MFYRNTTMRNTIKTVILFSFVMMQMNVLSQTILPLYNGSIPNSKPAPDEETSIVGDDKKLRIHKISRPTLTALLQ